MIKPDGLWNFFKSAPDFETIGRVCMKLAGREDELPEPINKYELAFVREILNSDEWHEQAADRIVQRKRRDYLNKKSLDGTITGQEKVELSLLNSELSKKAKVAKVANMEKTAKEEISLYPSVRPSVLPSVPPKDISASHSLACAGARDASPSAETPFDLDWFIADFERMDQIQRLSQGKVVTRQELEAWYDWQKNVGQWHLGGGLAITKENYRKYVIQSIPKIRRMLRERAAGGDAGMSLHQITREEFAAYCAKLNEGFSVPQVTSDEEEAVWASLVALNYHLLNGQLVTTGNIGYFTRPELKRIREEAEANRSQEEQEDVYQNPAYRKFVAFFHDSVELLNLKARIGLDGIKRMSSYHCLAQVAEWSKQGLCPKPEDLHKHDVKELAFKAFDKVRRIKEAEKAAKERHSAHKS